MKKFKTKNNQIKVKIIILMLLVIIIFIILSFFKLNKSYDKTIRILLNNFNHQNNLSLNVLTSNLDYLVNTYSFKDTTVYQEHKNKIYLYNTHNLEEYRDTTEIIEANKLLKNNLNKLGIEVILEERKPSQLIHTGISDYNISRLFIKDIMNKEKNIKYYIDIHRDSVKDTAITINNKKYAKILFVLGLDNKNYLKNREILNKMNNYLESNYPGISRGIYEKKGKGVDGIYNQDLNSNILLIEIGGIENNIDEVNNSTEILALMIYHMIGD